MRPEDVPADLPPHPEEERLRHAELQLADTIKDLSIQATRALRAHDRVQAAVTLAGLAQTAAQGQKAEVAAINGQMKLVREADGDG